MIWQTLLSLKEEIAALRAKCEPAAVAADGDMTPPSIPSAKSLIRYNADDDLALLPPLDRMERDTIAAALEANGGDKKKTAAQLNISLRTLYRKIKELDLT